MRIANDDLIVHLSGILRGQLLAHDLLYRTVHHPCFLIFFCHDPDDISPAASLRPAITRNDREQLLVLMVSGRRRGTYYLSVCDIFFS